MVTGKPAILLHELMVCKAMVGKAMDRLFCATLSDSSGGFRTQVSGPRMERMGRQE